jgi:hypothetical protein
MRRSILLTVLKAYALYKVTTTLPVLQSRILAFRDSKSLEIFPGNLVITKAQRRYGWMALLTVLHFQLIYPDLCRFSLVNP